MSKTKAVHTKIKFSHAYPDSDRWPKYRNNGMWESCWTITWDLTVILIRFSKNVSGVSYSLSQKTLQVPVWSDPPDNVLSIFYWVCSHFHLYLLALVSQGQTQMYSMKRSISAAKQLVQQKNPCRIFTTNSYIRKQYPSRLFLFFTTATLQRVPLTKTNMFSHFFLVSWHFFPK